MGFMSSHVTQKPKYSISVFLMKAFSMSHLSTLPSVYLGLIPNSVHDMSSLLLLIPKFLFWGKQQNYRKIIEKFVRQQVHVFNTHAVINCLYYMYLQPNTE